MSVTAQSLPDPARACLGAVCSSRIDATKCVQRFDEMRLLLLNRGRSDLWLLNTMGTTVCQSTALPDS